MMFISSASSWLALNFMSLQYLWECHSVEILCLFMFGFWGSWLQSTYEWQMHLGESSEDIWLTSMYFFFSGLWSPQSWLLGSSLRSSNNFFLFLLFFFLLLNLALLPFGVNLVWCWQIYVTGYKVPGAHHFLSHSLYLVSCQALKLVYVYVYLWNLFLPLHSVCHTLYQALIFYHLNYYHGPASKYLCLNFFLIFTLNITSWVSHNSPN